MIEIFDKPNNLKNYNNFQIQELKEIIVEISSNINGILKILTSYEERIKNLEKVYNEKLIVTEETVE